MAHGFGLGLLAIGDRQDLLIDLLAHLADLLGPGHHSAGVDIDVILQQAVGLVVACDLRSTGTRGKPVGVPRPEVKQMIWAPAAAKGTRTWAESFWAMRVAISTPLAMVLTVPPHSWMVMHSTGLPVGAMPSYSS